MNQGKGPGKIGLKQREAPSQRLFLRHHYVIMVGLRLKIARQTHGFLEAPANAIAQDGAAYFFCNRKADARPKAIRRGAPIGLKGESVHSRTATARGALKIGAALQAADPGRFTVVAHRSADAGLGLVHLSLSARPQSFASRARGIRRKDACGRAPDAR
jgi:hypothetical protein